jgi:hypothetical protein
MGMTERDRATWAGEQRQAAARLDTLVSGLLAELAGAVGGVGRGVAWEIVAVPDEAAWRLYRLRKGEQTGIWRYQELGVRATVAPDGSVVALQVDNGEEFLALVDTSASGLRRGLLHLLSGKLPVREAGAPPFQQRPSGPLAQLRRIFRRDGPG